MAMERGRLVELAPQYYACAICAYIDKDENKIVSSNTLWNSVTGMKHGPTFWHVLNKFVEKKMLQAVPDDFGPTIYIRTDGFSAAWQEMRKQPNSPYYKWDIDPQGHVWLVNALESVNKALEDQKIKREDFAKPDLEWEPIPVDRKDPKLQAATGALDKTIQEVQQDNGYTANVPGERDFVLDSLKTGVEKLKKDDSISFAHLRRTIIEPLTMIINRFGKAALGLTASAARQALFEWLKSRSADLIHWLAPFN